MNSILIALFATIMLPLAHLGIDNSDTQWHVLSFSDRIIPLLWCIAFFLNTPKKNINVRSLLAVGIVFTFTRLPYYVVWYYYDIKDLWVYPVATILCFILFINNAFKSYSFKSDIISDENIYLCFWKPENAKTIFPSLFGAAIGSVSIYSDRKLYGFQWKSKQYQVKNVSPQAISKKFIVVDTGKKITEEIKTELLNLKGTSANFLGIPVFRFKCIFTIRKVLYLIDKDFKPELYEYIPSIYSNKILGMRHDRRHKTF